MYYHQIYTVQMMMDNHQNLFFYFFVFTFPQKLKKENSHTHAQISHIINTYCHDTTEF
jgi:hypothetical protein